MQYIGRAVGAFFKKADMLLLLLCIIATIFGIVAISSATRVEGSTRYVMVQSVALVLGIAVYVLFTLVDVDIIAERRELLLIFSLLFIGCLKFWGISGETGNRSWLDIPLLPINVQPAEVCKIFFIIILAKMMSVSQNRLSSPLTVGKLGGLTILFFLLIIYASSDLGVALIYLFIFLVMAFVGGVNIIWFLMGFGALVVAAPILFAIMRDDQKDRIMMIFDPSIDPTGQGVRWQTNLSLRAITNGGLSGQGLYNGTMVKSSSIPAQHTDFIFSAIAEELGILGCVAVSAAVDRHRSPVPARGRQIRQLYEPYYLRRHRQYAGVPDHHQCGRLPGSAAGHRPDAALHQLRRLLDLHHVYGHGRGLRHPYAPGP